MKRVAISIGDINGIGIEIALKAHNIIKERVKPLYMIDREMLESASKLLKVDIPNDFETIALNLNSFAINPGEISKDSGYYSFASFKKAVDLAKDGAVDAIATLPIHKKAWELAGVGYKGHTDALRDFFKQDAIMMLGCNKLFVALYTEHIPLKDVPKKIQKEPLKRFLLNFAKSINSDKIAVLGLNPHAGDGGVLGDEESIIIEAIEEANQEIDIFDGVFVPDIAFTPKMRQKYRYFVAMYHDQGLAPLKALYFDESINVSLNLPILRTSVDHGTAFDIAYRGGSVSLKSYINAIEYINNEK